MGQAAKRKKILEPLEALGIDKITGIEDALKERFGAERAEEITGEWSRLSEASEQPGHPGSQTELYDYLHGDPELSRIVTNYTDAAIIREVCLWLYDHRNLFGKEILDIGCGTGIISCFLAKILPEAHITAVDRSESCIQRAEENKQLTGAENACFYQTVPANRTFDTVLSVRTFHENIGIRKTELRFLPFSKQLETYTDIYRAYIKQLASLTEEGGRLVCIERNHMDTELLGVFTAMQRAGLSVQAEPLSQFCCSESDFAEPSVFQAFTALKKRDGINSEELFCLWKENAFSKSSDPEFFTRAQADWFIEKEAGSLLEGYTTFDANGTMLAKACLLEKKDDPEQFLMYQANYYNAGVQVLPQEALEEAKEVFAEHKTVDAARGFTVREL